MLTGYPSRLRVISLLALLVLTLAPRAYADELARIAAIADGGATDLALRMLAAHQPTPDDQQAWISFERERFAVLTRAQRWREITQRVDALPADLPPAFVQWALDQAANACLAAEDGACARKYLRRLIWGTHASTNKFAQWRRLVVRSYLLDDDIADAHVALLRYQQDYRANNDAWRLLHAKVLLRAARDKAAFDVLQGTESTEGKMLRALAGMRSGIYKASAVKTQGLRFVELTHGKPELEAKAWALVAEAAGRASDDVYRVIGLERTLSFAGNPAARDGVFVANADDLWQAYEFLAETLGNRLQLLIGNDPSWLEQARYYENEDKSYARAFYAFLTRRGAQPETRLEAHKRLTELLFEDGREEVVRALYMRSRRFPTLADIPASVRYHLADLALAQRDVHTAAGLLKGLDDPPAGEDRDQWSLRRARVLIYAGEFKNGALLLSHILDNKRTLDPKFADRYLQVLFDLQAVDRHNEAYVLFDSIYPLVDPGRQREILYWMAESKGALGDYQQAAELYLRSAYHDADKGDDPWGQTARFHAGEALAKAGLVADARNVYQQLLVHTADPRRRAVIEREIEQLWLRSSTRSSGDPAATIAGGR